MNLVILRYIEGQNTYFKRRWPKYSLPLIITLEFLSRFEIHKNKSKSFETGNWVQSVKIPPVSGSMPNFPHTLCEG